jgi:hypothetical protein
MKTLRDIVSKNSAVTVIIIEHNEYLINNADFIIDFGKRKETAVNSLELLSFDEWKQKKRGNALFFGKTIGSEISRKSGITEINSALDEFFSACVERFKGGLLKNSSQTARWIYGGYECSTIAPQIAIDLEDKLYSENTFLFEIADYVNHIIAENGQCYKKPFDFFDKNNLCTSCKGTGVISSYPFELCIEDDSQGLFDGLLKVEVMERLRNYNFSKIRFLFKEIKKELKMDLLKPFNSMTEKEKSVFLYGYFRKEFYDPKSKTSRFWQGLNSLIFKYMKPSKSALKESIKKARCDIVCPICGGSLLNHDEKFLIGGRDIRDIIRSDLSDETLSHIELTDELNAILGNAKLCADVSQFEHEKQVQLKLLEIMNASFYGYDIVLKNATPFRLLIDRYIRKISRFNKVILCDWGGIDRSKADILMDFAKYGIEVSSHIYELFGLKKINTEIKKIRKTFPCSYCDGKRILRDESIFENVDVTETPCTACGQSGVSPDGLKQEIHGAPVETWLFGSLRDVFKNIPPEIADIKVSSTISDLNKWELSVILNCIENKRLGKK